MPQIESTQPTNQDVQQQTESQESLQNNILDKIKSGDVFKSFDLPIEEQQPQERIPKVNPTEETQEEEEDQQQEEDSNQEDTQEEEEVIPKSKIQPRIDQMRAQITRLEQKLADREKAAPVDDIQRQLDGMSEDDLENSLTQVRVAKEKARDDDSKLMELVKLERRIEKTIVQAPQKFVQNQISEFNKAADRLSSSGDITNDNGQKVVEIAKDIYNRYPKLKSQVDGQAMALELAVEHYKEVSKNSSVKVNTQNLKGQLNTLKKKTALDTKAVKGGGDKVNLDKLRNNAMTGNMRDKERFAHNDPRFKIDAMIPDYLKG